MNPCEPIRFVGWQNPPRRFRRQCSYLDRGWFEGMGMCLRVRNPPGMPHAWSRAIAAVIRAAVHACNAEPWTGLQCWAGLPYQVERTRTYTCSLKS